TADQRKMTTSSARLGRNVGIGGALLALVFAGVVAYLWTIQTNLTEEIALARAEAAERAEKEFRQADLETLQDAVYLLARNDGGVAEAACTAWAFAPGKLATNAHVTEAIKGRESEVFLVAPDGEKIEIE